MFVRRAGDTMKILYTAGPYGNKTAVHGVGDGVVGGVEENIKRAKDIAAQLWDAGHAVICPHANTEHFEKLCKKTGHEQFLNGDIAIISRCDVVVMLPGWQTSQGAQLERRVAQALGKDVYYWETDSDFLLFGDL
jgi:nucleoside 2-deoxyribosyltransferase